MPLNERRSVTEDFKAAVSVSTMPYSINPTILLVAIITFISQEFFYRDNEFWQCPVLLLAQPGEFHYSG
jgi:hypothetical protein